MDSQVHGTGKDSHVRLMDEPQEVRPATEPDEEEAIDYEALLRVYGGEGG